TFDVGQMAYGAELAASPDGRELVVATLYTSRGGGEEMRFDLVDVATGAVRVTRRMRPTWASGHLHPMLTANGTVCLSPDDDMGTYVLEPRPAFDLRRGTPMKPSPAVDRLCFGDGVLELPAA